MALSFNTLNPHLLSPFNNPRDIVPLIKEIQKIYTIKRDGLFQFEWTEKLVSAYTLTYLATNMYKMPFVLNKLPEYILTEIKEYDWIDFGCGPGTFTFALKEYFKDFSGSILGVDKNLLMLRQAKLLATNLYPEADLTFSDELILPKGNKDIVMTFGHVANEMPIEMVIEQVKQIKPKYIFFFEPGTKASFEQMLKIRKELIDLKFNCLFPCASNGPCPMESTDNWCHNIVKSVFDNSLEQIYQMAKLDRRTMPLTAHVYGKRQLERKVYARIIRLLKETKHSFIFEACNNQLNIERIEIQKKGQEKKSLKLIKAHCSGLAIFESVSGHTIEFENINFEIKLK